MNIVHAEFDWISLIFILFAVFSGLIKSFIKKSPATGPEDEEGEEGDTCFPEDMREEVKTFRPSVKKENTSGNRPAFSASIPRIRPEQERPATEEGEIPENESQEVSDDDSTVGKEDNRPDFDIRQAVISSEILRRPEF